MDHSVIFVGIIVGLLGLIIFGLVFAEDDYSNIDMNEWEGEYSYEIICELKNRYPYYDCPYEVDGYFDGGGQLWVLVTVDTTIFPDIVGVSVFGYAVYNDLGDGIGEKNPFSVCHRFPALNQTYHGIDLCGVEYAVFNNDKTETCYSPYPCINVEEHEIKHLKCQCDWHKGLIGKMKPIIINGPL